MFRPKERTDGTVAWLAACMAHTAGDPNAEPRHFQAALSIPHWRAAMEQEFRALQKMILGNLFLQCLASTSLISSGFLKSRDMLMVL